MKDRENRRPGAETAVALPRAISVVRPQAITVFTADSDIEAEIDYVAVAHDVVLALDPGLAGGAGGGDRTGRHEVVE